MGLSENSRAASFLSMPSVWRVRTLSPNSDSVMRGLLNKGTSRILMTFSIRSSFSRSAFKLSRPASDSSDSKSVFGVQVMTKNSSLP